MTPSVEDQMCCSSSRRSQCSLGCYGDLFAHTPCLDNLAEEGIRFEQSLSVPVVWTFPDEFPDRTLPQPVRGA